MLRTIVLIVASLALSLIPTPVQAHQNGETEALIRKYWPGDDEQALRVTYCETGGTMDPHIVSNNGMYHGLWQQGTHQADHYPKHGDTWEDGWHDAGKSTVVAWDILQSEGWGAWPHCARMYR